MRAQKNQNTSINKSNKKSYENLSQTHDYDIEKLNHTENIESNKNTIQNQENSKKDKPPFIKVHWLYEGGPIEEFDIYLPYFERYIKIKMCHIFQCIIGIHS